MNIGQPRGKGTHSNDTAPRRDWTVARSLQGLRKELRVRGRVLDHPLLHAITLGEMGWLPPSPDGIAMCQEDGLRTMKRRGRRDERYNDRGGSGKECFPAS
ncbi:MAG: hypothetical protein JJU19_08155, partial [Pararhodobacter sp.]|nr:hypothetical protein [Pararhodobacter sp.]